MSGQIGQTGRKKDQKSTLLLKSRNSFFKVSNAKENSRKRKASKHFKEYGYQK